ncbi:MAG: hypothetical protein ACT4QG_17870 [Sporichthyaceae bacterium]
MSRRTKRRAAALVATSLTVAALGASTMSTAVGTEGAPAAPTTWSANAQFDPDKTWSARGPRASSTGAKVAGKHSLGGHGWGGNHHWDVDDAWNGKGDSGKVYGSDLDVTYDYDGYGKGKRGKHRRDLDGYRGDWYNDGYGGVNRWGLSRFQQGFVEGVVQNSGYGYEFMTRYNLTPPGGGAPFPYFSGPQYGGPALAQPYGAPGFAGAPGPYGVAPGVGAPGSAPAPGAFVCTAPGQGGSYTCAPGAPGPAVQGQPGTNPGTLPGTNPGTNPGVRPFTPAPGTGTTPGVNPGATRAPGTATTPARVPNPAPTVALPTSSEGGGPPMAMLALVFFGSLAAVGGGYVFMRRRNQQVGM